MPAIYDERCFPSDHVLRHRPLGVLSNSFCVRAKHRPAREVRGHFGAGSCRCDSARTGRQPRSPFGADGHYGRSEVMDFGCEETAFDLRFSGCPATRFFAAAGSEDKADRYPHPSPRWKQMLVLRGLRATNYGANPGRLSVAVLRPHRSNGTGGWICRYVVNQHRQMARQNISTTRSIGARGQNGKF